MLKKFIDYTGLQTVINWIKETFVQKETGKGLSTEDYTTTDKQKVTAIPDNPKYTDTIQDLTPYLEKSEASTTYATKTEVGNVAITQSDIDRLRGMSLDLFITEAQYEALSTEAKNLPLTIYNFIEEA